LRAVSLAVGKTYHIHFLQHFVLDLAS